MNEKIAKLYQNLKQEGVDDIRLKDIIQKVEEYYEYLTNYNLEELDYIGALKAVQYGRFLKSNNVNGDNAKIWKDAQIYSKDDVVIWRPRNFQESKIIGTPQWCISYRDYNWNSHVIQNGETIYIIYNGWVNEDLQYTSACVERNGNIIIYDSSHNQLNDVDKTNFLRSLGDGASLLKPVPQDNNQLNCNTNMNKKLIRLTESDLHRVVKESVKKILKEGVGDNAYLQQNIQQAIFSLSAVASALQKESESHVYGGDSEMIPNGNAHFEYNKIYELCLKTMKALQSIQ